MVICSACGARLLSRLQADGDLVRSALPGDFFISYVFTFEQRYASVEGGLSALLFAHLLQLSVLLFSAVAITLALLAEYQSRMKAEKLALEIEEIARKLERTEIGREIHDSLGHSLLRSICI
ncbi:MAG: hypothetical protein HC888_07635 [Candidatus Competibacteraceae bacterium]|nr:hypothetical protein [Candidatus Competibacteraceae bacterium]